ncbi:helix-turn-helix domain-containing protein [Streptomyces griseoincarnatus]
MSSDPHEQSDDSHYPPHLQRPPAKVLSINQIVAFNMWRARRSQGWSQQDVADLLEKYTGKSWSNASVSAAERSWQGGRPRRFDANEIVALSRIFDEPVAYFFMPPEGGSYDAMEVGMREFPEGQPNRDPVDKESDLLALVPAVDYVQSIGLYQPSPPFVFRMQELALQFAHLSWEPPTWQMPFKPMPLQGIDEDVDWSEVQRHADETRKERSSVADRVLSDEQKRAFIQENADELALRVAQKLAEMGLIRRDENSDWGGDPDSPPPF